MKSFDAWFADWNAIQQTPLSGDIEQGAVEAWDYVESRIPQWQPIATAPMDGSPFLTYSPPIHKDDDPRDCYDIAYWDEGFGSFAKMGCGFASVTHWKPVHPPTPTE